MRTFRSCITFATFSFTLLAGAGLTGCTKKSETATELAIVRDVQITQVKNEQATDFVDTVGTAQASESAMLSSQVMGTVASVTVREGDRVRAGQTLISIDAAQLRSDTDRAQASVGATAQAIAAAESDAGLAASTLKRYQALKEQKSVSPQEFDEVQAKSQVASAHLEMTRSQQHEAMAAESTARTMQGYTRIHAPFDGVVTERKVDPGALATPGSPLLTIEKSGALRLVVSVDESLLQTVRVGAKIPVTIDALGGSPVDGKVALILPAADPGSRSFVVKIDLPSEAGLRSGMFGRARFAHGSKTVLLVPFSSVVTHGSLQSVYVEGPNQVIESRYVTLGAAHGTDVEALSGLSSGEMIVNAPGERELAGKLVGAKQ